MSLLSYIFIFITTIVLTPYLVETAIFSCNTTAPCGCSKNPVIIDARIVGGEPAASHSWAWAVSLRINNDDHFCGGSILSPHYILTAAHCIVDPYISMVDITAVIGIDNLYDSDGQRILVSTRYAHPNYNSFTKENDIAILRLKKAISFKSSNIAKLCLPSITETIATDFPAINSDLVGIGWGKRENGLISSNLRQVTLTTVNNTAVKCANSINNVRLQFCAAVDFGGKDTCQGDSGGPLMYYSTSYQQWMVAGITSYGTGCGLSTHAGVYTRATMYVDWIQSIVGKDGVVISGEDAVNIGVVTCIFHSHSFMFIVSAFILVKFFIL